MTALSAFLWAMGLAVGLFAFAFGTLPLAARARSRRATLAFLQVGGAAVRLGTFAAFIACVIGAYRFLDPANQAHPLSRWTSAGCVAVLVWGFDWRTLWGRGAKGDD